jgi:hypothetical protein
MVFWERGMVVSDILGGAGWDDPKTNLGIQFALSKVEGPPEIKYCPR